MGEAGGEVETGTRWRLGGGNPKVWLWVGVPGRWSQIVGLRCAASESSRESAGGKASFRGGGGLCSGFSSRDVVVVFRKNLEWHPGGDVIGRGRPNLVVEGRPRLADPMDLPFYVLRVSQRNLGTSARLRVHSVGRGRIRGRRHRLGS